MSAQPTPTERQLAMAGGPAAQFRVHPAVVLALAALVSLLLGAGILLLCRRFWGALPTDLPSSTLCGTALVATGLLAAARIVWRRYFPLTGQSVSLLDWLIGGGSSLALACLALGCSYPGSRTSEWLIWLPLLVADQFWRQNFFTCRALPTTAQSLSLASPPPEHPAPAENILQQLFRVRETPDQEVIYGTLRADFQPGQRLAVVHAGFCPPLSYLPEIEADPLPGYPARIKVVQALAHGVRLDVRLTAPAEETCHVWIDLAARPGARPPQSLSA